MKFFKYFVITFFSFIGLIIIASFFLPGSLDTEVTTNVKIKKIHIHKFLSDINNIDKWSMWGSYNDSTLTFTASVNKQNKLPEYKWKAELLGEGSITITDVRPDTLMFLTKIYEDEFELYGFISLKQIGNETIIYRRQTIDLGSNPVYKVVGYLMQDYIKTDLESELLKIKDIMENMKPLSHNIKILYDNTAQGEKYKYGWGFSCLVNDSLLFDTGEDFEKLQYNISEMDIDLSKIKILVISHDHWDHTGGLKGLLPLLTNLEHIYLPESPGLELKNATSDKAVTGNSEYRILSDVMTLSKSFKTSYKGQTLYEQALLLKTEDSTYTLIAGCAHPGIDIMADAINKDLGIEIKTVMGGFHLSHSTEEDILSLTDNLKAIGIRRVAPTHCSGKKAKDIFRNAFEEEFISIYTGKEVEID